MELLEMAYDGWPRFDLECTPLDYWKWKYQDNPLKLAFITVARSNDKMIGCSHSILSHIKVGEEVILGGSGYDAAVHPDFRGRGIFSKMSRLRDELRLNSGMKFAIYESSDPYVTKSHSKVYPSFPHAVVYYARIHDVDLHLRRMPAEHALIKKYGFHLANTFNNIRNKIMRIKPPHRTFSISAISDFDDRIDEFWREIKDHHDFIVERTRDRLNWRYCDPRGGDYLIRVAEEDERILGYIVLRVNRHLKEYPVGFIVDLIALPERLDIICALVEDAVKNFDNKDINIILCLIVKNHTYVKALNEYGFINSRFGPHLFYELHAPIEDELERIKKNPVNRIYFSFGDQDWI